MAAVPDRTPEITVYGCEQDEAALFHEFAPRFGVRATTTPASVCDAGAIAVAKRCISVDHTTRLTRRDLLALQAAGVEHVSTRSIGLDHIDLDAAGELGVTVDNVTYSPDGVADFTLMLILMAIRNATGVLSAAARHDFRLGDTRGRDLCDLTVGVVGAGNIGRAVIERLRGFGCRVLVSDTRPVPVAELVTLDELLNNSDVVTLHVPLTDETHHLIGREQIGTMRQGAVLVNTARGALVDTDALIVALENGQLGSAALDVLEGEDGLFYADHTAQPVDHPFLPRLQRLPNVIVTPHVAFHTVRMLSEAVEATLTNCLTFERKRTNDEAQDRDLVRGMLGGA